MNKEILDLYNQGVITKMEMFIQWRNQKLEPAEEHREEFLSWSAKTPEGSPVACIVA